MALIKVSEANQLQVDWMVATAQGLPIKHDPMGFKSGSEAGFWIWDESKNGIQTKIGRIGGAGGGYSPTTNWAQGGLIIDNHKIDIKWSPARVECFATIAVLWPKELACGLRSVCRHAPTALLAAMRAYVVSVLGDEIEVPDASLMS